MMMMMMMRFFQLKGMSHHHWPWRNEMIEASISYRHPCLPAWKHPVVNGQHLCSFGFVHYWLVISSIRTFHALRFKSHATSDRFPGFLGIPHMEVIWHSCQLATWMRCTVSCGSVESWPERIWERCATWLLQGPVLQSLWHRRFINRLWSVGPLCPFVDPKSQRVIGLWSEPSQWHFAAPLPWYVGKK